MGTVVASDPDLPDDALTFTLTGDGPDDGLFSITAAGELSFAAPPDFENPTDLGGTPADNVYEVQVHVQDAAGETATATVTVIVEPVNDNAPVFTSSGTVEVPENSTAVQTISATDDDLPAQTVTFSITGNGADDALFQIVGGNQLEFISAPDFENPTDTNGDNVYEVEIEADDGHGGCATQTVRISVTPVDDEPPTADIVDVAPDPRSNNAGTITVDFSEDVTGVDISDFTLTRDGNRVAISGLQVQQVDAGQYTIDLETVTSQPGEYVLTLVAAGSGIADLAGNLLDTDAEDTFVVVSSTIPQVESVQIDDGTGQRGSVRSITIKFDSVVTVDDGAFEVRAQDGTAVTVSAEITIVNAKTQAVLTFSGPLVDASGSLVDGRYTLAILDGYVREAGGTALDGDGDGIAGGGRVDDFFRLLGDKDGDAKVDDDDYTSFAQAFGTTADDDAFDSAFDADGDGVIGYVDYAYFRYQYGKEV